MLRISPRQAELRWTARKRTATWRPKQLAEIVKFHGRESIPGFLLFFFSTLARRAFPLCKHGTSSFFSPRLSALSLYTIFAKPFLGFRHIVQLCDPQRMTKLIGQMIQPCDVTSEKCQKSTSKVLQRV